MFRRTPPAPARNGHKNGYGNGNVQGNGHGNAHQPEVAAAPAKAPPGIETVLGANSSYNGVLTANAGVRVDGSFDGTIEVNGLLVIGEGARIVAESIRAAVVTVAGSVKGNIVADKVEILRSGRIYGDINVMAFVTEEGAILRGNVTMRDEATMGDDTRPISVAAGAGHAP